MINAIIIEDEPIARRLLHRMLQEEQDVRIVATCENGMQAVEAIKHLKPELLFLDIQMPEMNAFDVIRSIDPAELPFVIFVTAYDRYAVKAFEVHALDYLLKPFDQERLQKAVTHAKQQIRRRNESQFSKQVASLLESHLFSGHRIEENGGEYIGVFTIKSPGRMYFVAAEDVVWIEAADNYAILHTSNNQTHVVRESMNRLEAQLDPFRFCRTHRSAIVKVNHIREVRTRRFGEWSVVLDDGTNIKVSRSRHAAVQNAIGSLQR